MKDAIKEEIGFFKLLFTICAAINVSLIGWSVNNPESKILTLALITAILIGIGTVYSVTMIILKLNT